MWGLALFSLLIFVHTMLLNFSLPCSSQLKTVVQFTLNIWSPFSRPLSSGNSSSANAKIIGYPVYCITIELWLKVLSANFVGQMPMAYLYFRSAYIRMFNDNVWAALASSLIRSSWSLRKQSNSPKMMIRSFLAVNTVIKYLFIHSAKHRAEKENVVTRCFIVLVSGRLFVICDIIVVIVRKHVRSE